MIQYDLELYSEWFGSSWHRVDVCLRLTWGMSWILHFQRNSDEDGWIRNVSSRHRRLIGGFWDELSHLFGIFNVDQYPCGTTPCLLVGISLNKWENNGKSQKWCSEGWRGKTQQLCNSIARSHHALGPRVFPTSWQKVAWWIGCGPGDVLISGTLCLHIQNQVVT